VRIRKYGAVGGIEENLPLIKRVLGDELDKASEDIVVRKVAEAIVKKVEPRDYEGEARAIHDWVKKHIRFTRDPLGVELVKTPRRLLMDYAAERKAGRPGLILCDCDESSLLLAALLRSIGHNAMIVLVDASPLSTSLSHAIVKGEVSPGRWTWMETVKDMPMGWVPNHTREVKIGS
jgi:hypothetical protein